MNELALETLHITITTSNSTTTTTSTNHRKAFSDSSGEEDDSEGIPSFRSIPRQSSTRRARETKPSFRRSSGGGFDSLFVLKRKYIEIEMYAHNRGDEFYDELDDFDIDFADDKTYPGYILLEWLKGVTEYKSKRHESKTTVSTTKQEANLSMNSVIWADKQQQATYDLEKDLKYLDEELEGNRDKTKEPEIKYNPNVNKEEEDNDDVDDEINDENIPLGKLKDIKGDSAAKQNTGTPMLPMFWRKKRHPRIQTENKDKEHPRKSIVNKSDSGSSRVSVSFPENPNENLLKLDLVSADNADDDDDELFLSRRKLDTDFDDQTTEYEKGEGEVIDGMTHMAIGEDPLSKPQLTAQSAMKHSVFTITPVPVSLTMSPLGAQFAPEADAMSSPPSLQLQSPGGHLSPSKTEKTNVPRITTPLSSKERMKHITRLQRYQAELERKRPEQQRKVNGLEEERNRLQEELVKELRKYITWHKPRLVRAFRRYALLKLGYLDMQIGIAARKKAQLVKKLCDVWALLDEATERVVLVDPSFYADPLATPPSPRDEQRLKAIGKCVRAARLEVRELVLESSRVLLLGSRRSSLLGVLNRIQKGALKGTFFEPDYEVQADFDSWLLDARTQEGRQVAQLCKAVSNPAERDVSPKDVVLFIDEFIGNIMWVYQITSRSDGAKLALLVQRALFPLIYEDVLRMYPEQQGKTLRSRDLALLERLEHLREERHPGIQIDPVFWSKGANPLVAAEKVIAYMPFQLSPPDLIYVLQKTIAAICQVGKMFLHHNLAADEIVPLLVHTIAFAAPPGLHEALFMMEYLSQDADRDKESGWCIASLEIALDYIEKLELKPKKGRIK